MKIRQHKLAFSNRVGQFCGVFSRRAWPVAAVLVVPSVCQAQAQGVQIYGLVDSYLGSTKLSGASHPTVGVEGGGMQTSFWGLAGTEDLGAGLRANFRLEGYLQPDTGIGGRNPTDGLFARNAYAGLEHQRFGEVRLGRLGNPLFLVSGLYDAFAFSTKLSPFNNMLWTPAEGRYVAGDTVWSNAVGYYSPAFGGFSFRGLYSLGEQSGTNASNNAGGTLLYDRGPFSAAFGIQRTRVGPGLPTGSWAQTAMLGGVSYDFSVVKLMATYAHTSTSGASTLTDTTQIGATVPVGNGKFLLSLASSRVRSDVMTDYRRHAVSGGYDYAFSKRTDVYGAVMFDKITGTGSGTTFAAGIRHKF
ncbi:porin [Cupriavidus sp. 8B]